MIEVSDGLATVDVGGVRLKSVAPSELTQKVHVCIKGEDVTLQNGEQGTQSSRNQLTGVIKWITPEGPFLRVGINCGFELTALVTRPACEELGLRVSDCITATIKAPSIHLMPMRDTPLSGEEKGW